MRHVFIGWDSREQEAYDVCAFSLRNRCESALHIMPLKHRSLRHDGLFTRPWTIAEDGQFIDNRDGKPFSTEFAFTRFLVPELAKKQDLDGWAMFVDCDFLFLNDVNRLFELVDPSKAVMVVKHHFYPPEKLKMDRMAQQQYARKNWSSLILWNIDHPANANLTSHEVNYQPGSWLHGFGWLKDEEIGSLPHSWNVLAGSMESEELNAIHYTSGGPWMEGYENCAYHKLWTDERDLMIHPRPTVALRLAQ